MSFTKPAATETRRHRVVAAAAAENPPKLKNCAELGPTMPSAIPRRDCQRNQRAAPGKDAQLFWFV